MKEDFSVAFENHNLKGDLLIKNSQKPNILCLHGAGKSDRGRFEELREFLFKKSFGSCSFDFIGHGETGGNLSSSSLLQRTLQACAVIKDQQLSEPLVVVGNSMSAYTALKVAEFNKVGTLIFFVPGMYTKKAYQLAFNAGFSEVIREEDNWLDSDAWGILADFIGKLLIIKAGQDKVVPSELTQKIFDSASSAEKKELYTVHDAPHLIMPYLDKHPNEREAVFTKVLSFVS